MLIIYQKKYTECFRRYGINFITTKEIFISSNIYTSEVGSKLNKKSWWYASHCKCLKNVFFTILEGKDFLNYFGFWPFKVFAVSQYLSSAMYLKKWLSTDWIGYCRNTDAKITASWTYLSTKISAFYHVNLLSSLIYSSWKSIEFSYLFIFFTKLFY